MTVNKWHKPLVVYNHNMNIIEIKKKVCLEWKETEKKCRNCYCWFSKSKPKWISR